jgi:hypothetical protein
MGSDLILCLLSYSRPNIVSKTIHTLLSPMNLLIFLIRITGKNVRQTSEPVMYIWVHIIENENKS